MNRPELNEIKLSSTFDWPKIIITMSEGQWDCLLQSAYEQGYTLLELNEDEQPIRAYRRPKC